MVPESLPPPLFDIIGLLIQVVLPFASNLQWCAKEDKEKNAILTSKEQSSFSQLNSTVRTLNIELMIGSITIKLERAS